MAGLSAAGAAAGTAIMPGIGTAVGGVLGALGDTFLGGGGGGGVSSPAPSSAAGTSSVFGSGLSADAWNVNFSGTQHNDTATGSRDITANPSSGAASGVPPPLPTYLRPEGSNGMGYGEPPLVAGDFYGVPWYVWAFGAVVLLWKSRR